MDREWGSKPGSGGAATAQNEAIDRRERLRRLALETIDLAKDPYFMRNHLGSYECKLCLTLHNNEGNYLAHTQGKRHQTNLAKRAAREAKDAPTQPQPHKRKLNLKKTGMEPLILVYFVYLVIGMINWIYFVCLQLRLVVRVTV